MPIHALPVEFSIDTTYIATDVLYERLVLNLPTSQFTYSHFAYKFHFAYKCVSFRLHTGNYDLEGLSRYKTDFDLLWSITLDDLVKTRGVQGTRLTRGGPALNLNRFNRRGTINRTENVKDQWQQRDGVLLRENAVHTYPPPSQVQAQVDGVM